MTKTSFNTGDVIGAQCRAYKEDTGGRDYLEDYLELLDKPISGKELAAQLGKDLGIPDGDSDYKLAVASAGDNALLYVPIAQRFTNELQIMVTRRKNGQCIGNILETDESVRESIAALEYTAYRLYRRIYAASNLTFNTIMHGTRFKDENEQGQRLIISICPRMNKIAFSELLNRYVVDEFPFVSASRMRHELNELKKIKNGHQWPTSGLQWALSDQRMQMRPFGPREPAIVGGRWVILSLPPKAVIGSLNFHISLSSP
jgi:hypothetical protein